ncbi:hypothetical protein Vretimale_16846 [Volvox reticuliferus]|uniref:Fibronectin type-III domain-containing protein n=1 Tax=Volvox reticuliferus TaxID=1737510 RepID=A0A8J4LX70_9CHLO|nr:hypothetical protein Vretifemale_18504 [Volvox reticuliferus]GIM13778.1 hypothetical protein Vretimale_16846 [Volvox reticuliferus]
MAAADPDPNMGLVRKVISACEKTDSLPHGDLSKRFVTLMQTVDGVAQTFFNSNPETALMLNGPTAANVTDVITTAAVIHICKAIAQTKGLFDFESTIKVPEVIAASDNHLGVNANFGINLPPLANEAKSNEEMLACIFTEAVPVTITYAQAVSWTPNSNNPTDGSPSHYLAGALLDDWVHSHLLQTVAQLPNGWKDLTETPGFTASMISYLSNKLNEISLLNMAEQNSTALQLIMYILCRLDISSYQQASATIRGCALTATQKDPKSLLPKRLYDTYHSFLGLVQGYTLTGAMIEAMNKDPFQEPVKQAAMKQQASVHHGGCHLVDFGGRPICAPDPTYTDITYGLELLSWLDRDGPFSAKHYGMRTDKHPNNSVREYAQSPGGCFVPGTLVLLANGTSIPIEKITEGDKILCRNSCDVHKWNRSAGIASSERVMSTSDRPFRVFGFNNEKPFFTAEHVFFTTTGLRALDPHMARAQNPWLQVGLLRPHDVVKRATEDGRYQLERIEHFTSTLVTGSVHGVHLREGLRSYHANGYLVFLNYPELTMERMMLGLRNLPVLQQLQCFQNIEGAKNSMGHVVGKFLPDAMQQAITAATSHEALMMRKPKPEEPAPPGSNHHALHNMNTTFILKPHIPKGANKVVAKSSRPAAVGATHVALSRGHVFVNNKLITNARLTRDQVHWTRPVPGPAGTDEVHFEHGAIHLHPHRRTGYGRVMMMPAATNDRDAAVVPSAPVVMDFTAEAATVTYKTWVSVEPVPIAARRDHDGVSESDLAQVKQWLPGPVFVYGAGEESCNVQVLGADGKLLYMETIFSTSGPNLNVHMILQGEALRTDSSAPHQFKRMVLTMSADSMDFSGMVVKFDPSRPDYEGMTYYWKGHYEDDDSAQLFMASGGAGSRSSPAPATAAEAAPPSPKMLSAFALGRSIADMHESHHITTAPHPITSSLATKSAAYLSTTNLYNLEPDKSYATLGSSLLKEAMLYHIPEDWRKNFFRRAAPLESSLRTADGGLDLVNITDEQKDFIRNKFGVAYISKLASSIDDYKKTFTDDEIQKLEFYLKGADPDCLASDPRHQELSAIAQALAFRQLVPLDDYVNDTTENWAEKFYAFLTTGPRWITLCNLAHTSDGLHNLQKHGLVLYCLTKKGGERLDLKLWKKVSSEAVIKNIRPLHQGAVDDSDEFKDLFRHLIQFILEEVSGDGRPVLSMLRDDVMKLSADFKIEMNQTEAENAVALAHAVDELRKDAMQFMITFRGPQWQRIRAWVDSIGEDGSRLKKYGKATIKAFGSLLGAALQVASIGLSIMSLVNFDSLSSEQKASVIVQTITEGTSMLESIGVKGYEALTGRAARLDLAALAEAERTVASQEVEMATNVVTRVINKVANAVETLKSKISQAIRVEVTDETAALFSKSFSVSAKVVRALGVAALLAATVISSIDIYNDAMDGTGSTNQKLKLAMDSLQLASTTILLAAEVTGIIFEATVVETFSFILGPIGVVLGIVALIIGFCIKSDPPAPPPDPVKDFIDKSSKPFLKTVKLQSYPDPVQNVNAVLQEGNTTALVTFEPPKYQGTTSITTFTVAAFEVGPDAELASGVPTQVVTYPNVTATMTGLKPGKSYTFHVNPSNGDQGDTSNMAQNYVSSNTITVPMAK